MSDEYLRAIDRILDFLFYAALLTMLVIQAVQIPEEQAHLFWAIFFWVGICRLTPTRKS